MELLQRLEAGMPIPYDGDKVVRVPAALAQAFRPGDRLVVVQRTGDLLHIPAEDADAAAAAVDAAHAAFGALREMGDDAISAFYEAFARRLEDESAFAPIREANEADVGSARERGRSVTRLILSDRMRADMVAGLRGWRDMPSGRGAVRNTIHHDGWQVEEVVAGLGVVGFVFEGRPNVFADATGVLRSGNAVVFRIGSDALGTARAIATHALEPALAEAGLPTGAASLVDSPSRAAGWAMFADPRLALAVARGSGAAVAQLGAVAAQHGTPVSLHGTGGAWIVADLSADADAFGLAVRHSLDRKVCNTLNTCVVVRERATDLVPVFVEAVEAAAADRGTNAKLHVAAGSEPYLPDNWFIREVPIARAEGEVVEPQAETLPIDHLGLEWEWEDSPEVTLVVMDTVDEAVDAFNDQSPRFTASLVAEDPAAHERFFARIDAPFVGNGFTRWVDGQYALDRPELGLSNWEFGRLFARSGVLSGDSVFTIRLRATQDDPGLHR
ncbi:MAG: aldehyde dehydrogenase family protein [Acidimicrobiia bacterium]